MNPLDGILEWYQTVLDALRVTTRVIDRKIPDAITNRRVFFVLSDEESKKKLGDAKTELDNLVVLAMVAVFERLLRDRVIAMVAAAFPGANPSTDAIGSELAKDAEFWNVSSRLIDVFVTVPEDIRGNAKQLVDFRNWVAHAHFLAHPSPINAEPKMAHRRLSEFLRLANLIP